MASWSSFPLSQPTGVIELCTSVDLCGVRETGPKRKKSFLLNFKTITEIEEY